MDIIDAHIHYSKISSFQSASEENDVDYSPKGWEDEAARNEVAGCVCMGLSETVTGGFPDKQAETPMAFDLGTAPANFCYCAGVNPHRMDEVAISNLELSLQSDLCAGIKIYAGYYHYLPQAKKYDPVYRLALKYDVPVVFHSGDTYSDRGLLKYSHPLSIDQLAYKYPKMKIVIAHLGNPWLLDTAEILYKNKNVYADLSGLLVGDGVLIGRFRSQELYLNMIKTALILADSYDKLLYGTDWPLVPMQDYIRFIKDIVPEEHHQAVFYDNAKKVYAKLRVSR